MLVISQIFFVDKIYEGINKNSIQYNLKMVSEAFENEELPAAIKKAKTISLEKWYAICLFNEDGTPFIAEENNKTVLIPEYSENEILINFTENRSAVLEYISYADENGGEYYVTKTVKSSLPQKDSCEDVNSVICIQKIELYGGGVGYCFLNANLSPLCEAADTIKVIFVIVAVILLIVISLMAFYLSDRLSRPIVEINEASKLLAKGNYDVNFTFGGYTEVTELGKSLNYAAKELKKTEKLQKELIANISHDLRTPLTMIIGYSEMMRDLPSENTSENMNVIIDEAKRLSSLVNDLLDLSRVSSGVDSLNKSAFYITDCISDILDRINQFNENKGIKIEFEYSSKVKVEADFKRISQVIYNLVNNAIMHAGEDRIITVRQRIRGNIVRIEVQDNGVGIPKDQLETIWDRYRKFDRNTKTGKQGSGIGLSIVKAILTAHNAPYGVISEVDKGSNFWFELHKFTLN